MSQVEEERNSALTQARDAADELDPFRAELRKAQSGAEELFAEFDRSFRDVQVCFIGFEPDSDKLGCIEEAADEA